MAPTWRQLSDEANYEPIVDYYPYRDGHTDWQAVEHRIAGNDTPVSVQAIGWTRPDGSQFSGIALDAATLSPAAARQLAAALLSAADDVEAVAR